LILLGFGICTGLAGSRLGGAAARCCPTPPWRTVQRFLLALDADLHQLADAIAEVEKQDRASKR
jgi:hypothetical protein